MPELRKDVERFLATHFCEDILPWSPKPFVATGVCFDTLAPTPSESRTLSLDDADFWEEPECSQMYLADDAAEDFAPKPKARRGGIPSLPRMAPKKKNESLFATGALPGKAELDRMLRKMDAGFSETLLELIDKTGKKDSEIYNKANVSRQHFSKIRNNPDYKPSKATAVAFAVALELDLEQTMDLIGRAGYALTNSSKFDVIIMYFIRSGNYNMMDINSTLYEFDQSLLGA